MTMTWPEFCDHARRHNNRCVSLALARRLDVPDGTWKTWQRRHDLLPLFPGARGLDPVAASPTLLRAALDSTGGSAMLGGRSALWALCGSIPDARPRSPRPLEVVVGHAIGHRADHLVHLRRSRTLVESDRIVVDGWPCTSPARTAMDLAAHLADEAALAIVIDLVFHGLVTAPELVERAERTPTAPGASRLERLGRLLVDERSDSIFEWFVRRHLEGAGIPLLPGPQPIATPDGTFELDIVLADRRVAIECQGATHREHLQMVRDIAKRDALSLADWLPLATTYAEFMADPDVLLDKVRRARRVPTRRAG